MTTPPSGPRAALKNGLALALILAAGWVVLAGPAWWLSGPKGLQGLTLAAALCLIPGWLVFAFQGLYGTAAPIAVVLVGAVGRMAAALLGVLVVKSARPDLGLKSFVLWLGAFYALSLATETKLLLTPQARGTPSED